MCQTYCLNKGGLIACNVIFDFAHVKDKRPFQITIWQVRISLQIPLSALFVTQCAKIGENLPYLDYRPYLDYQVITLYCIGNGLESETFDTGR